MTLTYPTPTFPNIGAFLEPLWGKILEFFSEAEPPTPTPEEKFHDRSSRTMAALFDEKETLEVAQNPSPDPDPEPEEDEEPEEEELEPEKEVDEEPEDDYYDYDNDDLDEEDEEDEEPEPESDPVDESEARRRAKENGRKVKELNTELAEIRLERDRLKAEAEEYQAKLEDLNSTTIDPTTHPSFIQLQDRILTNVERTVDRLPEGNKLDENFGNLIRDYLNLNNFKGTERRKALGALKLEIAETVNHFNDPIEELTDDEREEVNVNVDRVLDLLESQASPSLELISLHKDLQEKAKKGRLSVGSKTYERAVEAVQDVIDQVGTLSPELVKEDPYSIESVVTQLTKESPKMKERLERAKEDVTEVIFGSRPLTQVEIEKLEAQGTDYREFLKNREKRLVEKRRKLLPFFIQALTTRSYTAKQLKLLGETLASNQDEADEEAVLARLTQKQRRRKVAPSAPKPPEKKVDPRDRPLASSKLFEDD